MRINRMSIKILVGIISITGFSGCFSSNSPSPNVVNYIQEHKLSGLPKNKNLKILGLVNNNTCNIEKISDIISNEYKLYNIQKKKENFFVGKGKVYQVTTHNPTSREIGRCYGVLRMQQAYGRYRTREQANWYINECIKGFKKIKTFDSRIKIRHKIVKKNNLTSLKINIHNANLDNEKNEIGIYKNHNNFYLYTIFTSFKKSKMKNFDKRVEEKLKNTCLIKRIYIP